ncbi:hypothetical protein [Candidatus Poriferisodalis sp.]|uniref:hypothetical protein n=1 Tax=Candidatus Poriferisodalis sp. TaxID=3101277 RepID=UPI003B028325
MGKRSSIRRQAVPSCFRIVPSTGASEASTTAAPVQSDRRRDRLREAEAEAQQNWAALVETRAHLAETRERLTQICEELAASQAVVAEQRAQIAEQRAEFAAARQAGTYSSNRIRRLRSKVRQLYQDNAMLSERQLSEALQTERHLRERIRRLRCKVRRQSPQLAQIPELQRLAAEVPELRKRVAEVAAVNVAALQAAAAQSGPHGALAGAVHSVGNALEAATQSLVLSIPEAVVTAAVTEMDVSGKRASRGRAVLDALRALQCYALDADPGGDFRHWCDQASGAASYPANRIAMNESESVLQDPELRKERMFPVDPVLEPSGQQLMVAHIRLSNGAAAPRLYFFDDTRGPTRKIHIGYIGPHLPTKRFQ